MFHLPSTSEAMRGIVVIPLQTHPVEAEQIGVQGIAILELHISKLSILDLGTLRLVGPCLASLTLGRG